jgi:hypothetical protein
MSSTASRPCLSGVSGQVAGIRHGITLPSSVRAHDTPVGQNARCLTPQREPGPPQRGRAYAFAVTIHPTKEGGLSTARLVQGGITMKANTSVTTRVHNARQESAIPQVVHTMLGDLRVREARCSIR